MTNSSMDTVLQELLDQRSWIEGLCNALVRDRSQAQDLAQETLASAMQAKGPIANVRAYLRRVAENHALQRLRKDLRRTRRERAVAAAAAHATEPSAHDVGEAFETQREVARAVHGLTEPFRSTVLLHHFEGLSLAEIARRQQAPEGTVRWRLFRAHAQLREELRGTHGEDWKLALLPLCTPGLSRSVSAVAIVVAAMLLVGGAFLAWPRGEAVAVEVASLQPAVVGGSSPVPAADPANGVERTPVRPGAAPAAPAGPGAKATRQEDQRAMVRVRVLDEAGRPIEGAALHFDRLVRENLEMSSPLQGVLVPDARAAADGRAALPLRTDPRLLGDLPESMWPARGEPWQLAFVVRADGYLPAQRTVFVADGDDADLGDVRLQRGAVLRGRVVAKDGSTIGGARVGVFAPPMPLHLSTTQAANSELDLAVATAETASLFSRGHFELAPAPRGPVMLVVIAEGYRSGTLFVDVVGDTQDVLDLVLEPAARPVRGPDLAVLVVDGHGDPVHGALVERRHAQGGASGKAGPDGTVRFPLPSRNGEPDLAPATVIVHDPSGRLQSTIQEGVVPKGEPVTIVLPAGRVVDVVVSSPTCAAGDLRAEWVAEAPVAASLWLSTSGDHVRFVPPPFPARLRLLRDRCVPWVSEPIAAGAWSDRLEVRLLECTALHGTVEAEGRTVAGAHVLVLTRGRQVMRDGYRMGEWAGTGLFDATSDARGEFVLSRDERSEVRLLVSKDGFAPAVTTPFSFDPASPPHLPPIPLTRGGAVRGVLRTSDGAPLARTVIALHHPLFGPRTQLTQRDGSFSFPNVAPGDYEVRQGERPSVTGWSETPLGPDSALPTAVDAVVREGETTQVEVVADRCQLAVQVTATGSLRLAGWSAALREVLDGRMVEAARPLPSDGKVEFATARTGDYDVVLRSPGGPFGEVTVTARTTLLAGRNDRAVALALSPWRGTVGDLGGVQRVKLVQIEDGMRVEALAPVDGTKGEAVCPLAPVGTVEVRLGEQVVLRVDTRTGR